MANQNCSACEELRQDAPNLIVNGITNIEEESLMNNTGLNPASGNDDCIDLNNMNDCFIGNMDSELDAYDICDWKDYMKKLVPNVWTVLKGIISAICGLWDKSNNLCALISANISHPVKQFGMLPNGASSQQGGALGLKSGQPILVPLTYGEVSSDGAWRMQNVGIRYGTLVAEDCDGKCTRYEWLAPDIFAYKFNPNITVAYEDIVWGVDKATAMNKFGITQAQWNSRADNPITWATDFSVLGQALVAFRLSVENDRLVMRYYGSIGESEANFRGKTIVPPPDQAERLYKFDC